MKIGLQRDGLIYLARDNISGRGVFAGTCINAGDVIEASLAVPIKPEEEPHIDVTIVWDYYFWTKPHLPGETSHAHVLLGFGSFVNHSHDPNAMIKWKKDDLGVWGVLTATRSIKENEEISIHYTNIDDYVARGLISAESAYGKPPVT